MSAILTSEFFQQVLAQLKPDDIVLYTWVAGGHATVPKTSCCTGPFVDEAARPSTVSNDSPLRLAASLAFSYPELTDPKQFEFGIVHGVAKDNLVLFDAQLNDWIRRWMMGRAMECDYPRQFLDLVLAVSLEANRADLRRPACS
jgi:hypothetical protein